MIFGYNPLGGIYTPVQVTPAGAVVVSGGGAAVGATVGPTPADTAVGAFGIVALPVPLAASLSQIVQNTGPAGSLIRVRAVAGAAGTGIILPRFGIFVFDKAVAALAAEDIAGIPTSVMVTWERT
jgi:hypothetical protein